MKIEEINRQYEVILASASPRRRELLTQIGISFQVLTSDGEEVTTKTEPEQIVMELSAVKADAVRKRLLEGRGTGGAPLYAKGGVSETDSGMSGSYLIIAADTIVAIDGVILGKPKDGQDAVRMLMRLQGRTHQVYTGVTLLSPHGQKSFYECTEVTFVPLAPDQVEEYVRTGEPLDKAGAYGIQGRFAAYVNRIEGDYFNVVGLPLARLIQEIGKLGR